MPAVLALVPEEKFVSGGKLETVIRAEGIQLPVAAYIHHVLSFVLRRLKPDTENVPDLFQHTERCLDGRLVCDGQYTCPKGTWVCSHPDLIDRKAGKKLTLYKELQRIFCRDGNEAPARGHRNGVVLRHVLRTTREERENSGCGCANWTHTVLGTRAQNGTDLMSAEGGKTVCGFKPGEGNAHTHTANENVNRLRIETWELSCRGAPFLYEAHLLNYTVRERQDWTSDDPNWRWFKKWRRNNHAFLAKEAIAFGVSERTIDRYLDYATFKTVLRDREPKPYDLGAGVRKAQRALQVAEIIAARRLLDELVPMCYRHPRFVKTAELFIGLPECTPTGKRVNGVSTKVDQVIFRSLRRIQNERSGYKPHLHRDQYVRPDSLPQLIRRVGAISNFPLTPIIKDYVSHMDETVGRTWYKWERLTKKILRAYSDTATILRAARRHTSEPPKKRQKTEV